MRYNQARYGSIDNLLKNMPKENRQGLLAMLGTFNFTYRIEYKNKDTRHEHKNYFCRIEGGGAKPIEIAVPTMNDSAPNVVQILEWCKYRLLTEEDFDEYQSRIEKWGDHVRSWWQDDLKEKRLLEGVFNQREIAILLSLDTLKDWEVDDKI